MRGRVRRNQWIDGVIYNGQHLLLMEEKEQPEEEKVRQTTVFVCDGYHLKVGEISGSDYNLRCVLGHDPFMQWHNYSQYFVPNLTRVVTCYLKAGRTSIEDAADELTQYILDQKIEGKIILIGHSKAGLMMYRVGTKLNKKSPNKSVAVLTSSAPFGGTALATKRSFAECEKKHFAKFLTWIHGKICSEHQADFDIEPNSEFLNGLEPLPDNVNHIAFISTIYNLKRPCSGWRDHCLRRLDQWCTIGGDGIVSFKSQEKFPMNGNKKRMPDMCLVISATHNNSLERMLSEFGKYALGEFFFSMLEDFRQSDELESIIN